MDYPRVLVNKISSKVWPSNLVRGSTWLHSTSIGKWPKTEVGTNLIPHTSISPLTLRQSINQRKSTQRQMQSLLAFTDYLPGHRSYFRFASPLNRWGARSCCQKSGSSWCKIPWNEYFLEESEDDKNISGRPPLRSRSHSRDFNRV